MATPTGYQRVTTETDYDVSAYQIHLRFDGVDDSLVTNSIDFTGTDKMSVFAGVRKLSDASNTGVLVELGTNVASVDGSFAFYLPHSGDGTPNISFVNRGTLTSYAIAGGLAAPITNVINGIGNISGDSEILRVNGTQAASNASDQGTGNYGNYPLYIGRRGGTSLPFNGHLYQLIIRGAASSDSQIAATEKWTNQKTKAYA